MRIVHYSVKVQGPGYCVPACGPWSGNPRIEEWSQENRGKVNCSECLRMMGDTDTPRVNLFDGKLHVEHIDYPKDLTDWIQDEMRRMLGEEIARVSDWTCSIKEKHPAHWWEPIEGWTEKFVLGVTEWCVGSPGGQFKNLRGILDTDDIDYNTVVTRTEDGIWHSYSPDCPAGCMGSLPDCSFKDA